MKKLTLCCFLLFSVGLFAQDHLLPSRAAVDGALAPFYHGVASGDPLSDRVILWTRITSQNPSEVVGWQIATDTTFSNIVNSGSVTTDANNDFTVKAEATGLQANTWYYYRFSNNGINSITGRTRTMPVGSVSNLRFAVVACSNYQSGYFNAYNDVTKKNDVDAVIHLGDYYYEYGPSDFDPGIDSTRLQEPFHEVLNYADYCLRHSFYKLDPDLRMIHQQYPFITVWDDHESANNSWYGGAQNHDSTSEGNWTNRKNDSRRAYFHWMPIRDVHNSVDTIHRMIPMGDLADLIMIDTRLEGREEQKGTSGAAVTDTNRTMLGPAQLEWLNTRLSLSSAKWKLLGNQVMMAPLAVFGTALNEDQWDGYPAERSKILRHLSSNNIDNMVVLTGDIHTSWAIDIPHPDSTYNGGTGRGSAAVEFVCTSVTSGSFITFPVPANVITSLIPHIKYAELSRRGYLLLDITHQKVQGDWIYMSSITTRSYTASTAASWCALDGDNHLTSCPGPLSPRSTNPGLAPIVSSVSPPVKNVVMIAVYPNPTVHELAVQYFISKPAAVVLQVVDLNGKSLYTKEVIHTQSGLFDGKVDLMMLAAGTYILNITSDGSTYTKRFVKYK